MAPPQPTCQIYDAKKDKPGERVCSGPPRGPNFSKWFGGEENKMIKDANGRIRLDLSKERYDMSTFLGRYRHFFAVCNPMTLFASEEECLRAKDIVHRYKKGEYVNLTHEEIWRYKNLYDSALHPVNETIIPHVGRMSAQCPVNALLMGASMIFYRTTGAVVFWQWVNQSFNAFVNKMNSSDNKFELKTAVQSYAMAVGAALSISVAVSTFGRRFSPMTQRFIPIVTVALANAANTPLSRQRELVEGIQLWYKEKEIAKSQKMAKSAISMVVISRIMMQLPHMVTLPFVMRKFEPFFTKNPSLAIPFQFSYCAISLLFSTPLGCALFPHKTFVPVTELEPEVQEEIKQKTDPFRPASIVYFNKGL